ncbi:MAG: proton-conducting transporter membrane subunit [Candidatus Bathyarchaeia archaeon]|nr:proton-conducting transporter membrane subunit [Candidatus Bathyarchaeia archaeon]
MPIAVAVAAHPLARIPKIGNRLAKALCVATSYITLLMTLILACTVVGTGPIVDSIFNTPLPIGNFALSVYVDGLALIPTILSALFASLALTFSIKYLSPENRYRSVPPTFDRAYSFMLLFLGSMIGACFSGNMVALVIFWEITALCSYVLVAFWHEDPVCRASALKTLILTHIGTLGLLLGAIAIYPDVGTWEIHSWSQKLFLQPTIPLAMLLFFIGILPKAVQFPLHTWLPDATVAPTPVTAYVHVVGFLMGLYALPRFFSQVFVSYISTSTMLPSQLATLFGNVSIWNFIISITGAITLIIAPLFSLIESDAKRLIAYYLISALGSTVMALGFGTPLGTVAGLFAMVAHVFFCGLLFFATGATIFRVGKTSLEHMGGVCHRMPVTTVCASIGVLSSIGFPFLGYFTALWLIVHAALELNAPAFVVLVLLGSILKTAAILKLLHAIVAKSPEDGKEIAEAPSLMLSSMILLSAGLFTFGIFPQLLLNFLILPAGNQLGMSLELVAPLSDIIAASGWWNPVWTASVTLLSLGVVSIVIYASLKGAVISRSEIYIEEEEAFKPYLCGEDVNLLDRVAPYHFYYGLIASIKLPELCRAINIDRAYYGFTNRFSKICNYLKQRIDISEYHTAMAWFLVGTLIILLIILL